MTQLPFLQNGSTVLPAHLISTMLASGVYSSRDATILSSLVNIFYLRVTLLPNSKQLISIRLEVCSLSNPQSLHTLHGRPLICATGISSQFCLSVVIHILQLITSYTQLFAQNHPYGLQPLHNNSIPTTSSSSYCKSFRCTVHTKSIKFLVHQFCKHVLYKWGCQRAIIACSSPLNLAHHMLSGPKVSTKIRATNTANQSDQFAYRPVARVAVRVLQFLQFPNATHAQKLVLSF